VLIKFCTFCALFFLIIFSPFKVNAQETNQCRQRINQISQTIKKTNNVNVDFSITNDNNHFMSNIKRINTLRISILDKDINSPSIITIPPEFIIASMQSIFEDCQSTGYILIGRINISPSLVDMVDDETFFFAMTDQGLFGVEECQINKADLRSLISELYINNMLDAWCGFTRL